MPAKTMARFLSRTNFEQYGIDRHSIGPAIRELEALGLITVTRGRAAPGEHKKVSVYGLTYRQVGNTPPAETWKRIKTVEEARQIAARSALTRC
ncbi:MAG: hypothetical protein R3C54_05775 [Parvularculaceae bacterium]